MNLQSFLEAYHPFYSSSDVVARYLDLGMYLSGEMEESVLWHALALSDNEQLFIEFSNLQDKLFKEAFENYSHAKHR